MESHLLAYFQEEKKESIILITLGGLAIGISLIALLYFKTNFAKAIATPLVLFAAIQFAVGTTTFIRKNQQLESLLYQMQNFPKAFAQEEHIRMQKVIENFARYRNVEMLLFLLGFFFVLMGGIGNWGEIALGIGIGLSIQSAIMLILDLFASFRAELYFSKLKQFKTTL